MCGIAGIYAYRESAPPVDEAELLRIREHMVNRGPDGAGLWISLDRKVGLAHRRLAIIDLSESGAQPMATADGRLTISFNGEIYNYRELRRELEGKGYLFRSQSDTEVLLHLYADRGQEMVQVLRGMYAFAIWDELKKGLFLARDPFGIKPLYFSDRDGEFRFASQVKALLAGGRVSRRFDTAGVTGFFVWGFVPEPFTICSDIQALPAGSTLWMERGRGGAVRQFYSVREELAAAIQLPAPGIRERSELLRDVLHDSLRHHMVSDVPVGMFLSAGLDSTTIAAIAAEAGGRRLHTLTLGFQEYRGTRNDEVPLAELVAAHCGSHHKTAWITRSDFERDLDEILLAMDQPSTDGVNTYFVSKIAKEAGIKVALSGVGGDELFGGYPSFKHVPMIRRFLKFGRMLPSLGILLRNLGAPILRRFTSPKFASLLEYADSDARAYLLRRALFMPWELSEFLDERTFTEGWRNLRTMPALDSSISGIRGMHAQITALELQWYLRNQLLRDADWAGMAHSLEIRVPLIDHTLFRRIAPILVSSAPPTKLEFAAVPREPLPAEVLERSKTGFLVPVREWIVAQSGAEAPDRGLRGWARKILPSRRGKHVLSLVTDAFGGHGGIALYNRDLITALCEMPDIAEVSLVPRLIFEAPGAVPRKVRHVTNGTGGKRRYVLTVLRELFRSGPIDLIICGHINLLPLAYAVKLVRRVPLVLCIYGIDAWTRPRNPLARWLVGRLDMLIAISETTANRFADWSGFSRDDTVILPNAIHLEWYSPGPKSPELLRKYGLEGKLVISTLGRLVSEERYKGFDQVLDVMPELISRLPQVAYLIMGDGSDRERLESRAVTLGMRDYVKFTGFLPEHEKADHLRLSDAYVMPSRGEGFGFAVLEALACGLPVVGSKVDGTREALRDGMLGELVNPDDPREIRDAILRALDRQTGRVHEGLAYFDFPAFKRRVTDLVRPMTHAKHPGPVPIDSWS